MHLTNHSSSPVNDQTKAPVRTMQSESIVTDHAEHSPSIQVPASSVVRSIEAILQLELEGESKFRRYCTGSDARVYRDIAASRFLTVARINIEESNPKVVGRVILGKGP